MTPDWPGNHETHVVPLSESDPALSAELHDEFQRLIRAHLTDDELPTLGDIREPPRFDTAILGGDKVLKITFHGGQTWIGWDGSSEEARDIVRGMAETAAANVSGDHWMNGAGWQQKTSFSDPE